MIGKIFGNKGGNTSDWNTISSILLLEEKMRNFGPIKSPKRAGVIFRNDVGIVYMNNLQMELQSVLNTGEMATKTASKVVDDKHGMQWVVLEDSHFGDLVSSVYTVGNAIASNGGSNNLLAAVFGLYFSNSNTDEGNKTDIYTYWIYRYDRKAFYPFIPTGDEVGDRNRTKEISICNEARNCGIVLERDAREWMGIWGMPF